MNLGGIIGDWYKKNKRDLPIRHTRDPYRIWIAEVIMQQTRLNQGLPYYQRFIETFPNVNSLASASEVEVLNLWQGLGYYSRARNLQEAARDIEERFGGHMPPDYEGLLSLKGVGKYTAAAIASFCYGEPVAAVDGNVSRVIARLFGVEDAINSSAGARQIDKLAQEILDPKDPGTHNQAMIDLGATLCVPVSPRCSECPLSGYCEAFGSRRVDRLPVKIPKKRPVDRWIWFYVIKSKGEIVLIRRGTDDIWKSLYQFPAEESDTPLLEKGMMDRAASLFAPSAPAEIPPSPPAFSLKKISPEIKHQLTHLTLHARFIHLELESWPDTLPESWIKIFPDHIDDFPVPRLINRYMESFNF
jgi:A/G-specific adenine glycosylase